MWQITRAMVPTLSNIIFGGMDTSVARFIVDPAKLGDVQPTIDAITVGDLDGGSLPSKSEAGLSFSTINERQGLIQFGPLAEGERHPLAIAVIEYALGARRLPEDCYARAKLVPRNERNGNETHAGMIVQLFSALMSIGADVRHEVQCIAGDEAFFLSSMTADFIRDGVKLRVSAALRFDLMLVPPLWHDEETATHQYRLSPDIDGLFFGIRVGLMDDRDRNGVEGHQRLRSGLENLLGMLGERDRLRYDPESRQFGLVIDTDFRWKFVPDKLLMNPAGEFLSEV